MDAANDAQTVWVNTTCRKDHNQKKSIKTIEYCGIVTYINKSLQTPGKLIILFITS